ncbi:GDSL-type esterase/lipase family protein [Arthrobacter sp. MI7-26]|uniref:GDSL-type esterase/lipase family protein n=1 Tax=Arthrobacter sp. MI7-26 TaxID=2993653 RepID=UPI002249A00C|nr:GDSL-type esterase/lipase family protein [Arthrobacter sp. MI7-26]MCX2749715.1 GDSL-type esterase/lipase family protein [Arthrobacter sp. MI7-26]
MKVRWSVAVLVSFVAAMLGSVAFPGMASAATSSPFTFLETPFTQNLFASGSTAGLFGGVAFAPNGDVWADDCVFSGGSLHRFSQTSTYQQDGATLASETTVASGAGCGLTNNPDGFLYSNTSNGVVQINATTGAATGLVFGQPGNALGITTDPQTHDLVYVGGISPNYGAIFTAAPGGASHIFSGATVGSFIDGIAFDPSGNYLFLSNRSNNTVTILNRNGSLVQSSPTISGVPDGISFHSTTPPFVVTNNNDGTMTRLDFPNGDFTQTPTLSTFASGGYRGDLTQVGPDGCIYVTQQGTNFPDGTMSGANSIVKICPGFAPPSGVGSGGAPRFAAIGDSYMSGEGTYSKNDPLSIDYYGGEQGGAAHPQSTINPAWFNPDSASASDRCHRSPGAFAPLALVQEQDFVACSGATISQIENGRSDDHEKSQLLALNAQDTVVMVSAGGDDLGFSTVLGSCVDGPGVHAFLGTNVGPGIGAHQESDKGCKKAVQNAIDKIPTMQKNLSRLLGEIRSAAPNAQIVQIGYPRLFPAGGTGSTCSGLNKPRQNWLNTAADAADSAIAATDASVNVSFLDTRPTFADHELCSDSPYINDAQYLNPIGPVGPNNCPADYTSRSFPNVCAQSFHPNTAGYEAESVLVIGWLLSH